MKINKDRILRIIKVDWIFEKGFIVASVKYCAAPFNRINDSWPSVPIAWLLPEH
jgi:hypothetical protein